jgi:lantibiotic biosynthesis protein
MLTIHSHAGKLYDAHGELKLKARQSFENLDSIIRTTTCANDSLLNGSLGMILYYFTLYEAFQREEDAAKGNELLEGIFSRLNSGDSLIMNPSYSKGVSGFLYVLELISKNGFIDIDIREEREDLEEYLYEQALLQIEEDFNDYLHGAFGILFYFLERLPDEKVERYVRGILQKVFEKAVQNEEVFWLRNFLDSEDEKKQINLSLAHGQSGFLLILLQAFQQGIYPEKIYQAVKKGMGLIIKSRQDIDFDEKKYAFFPIRIQEETMENLFSHRMAWCYGDLNQLLLLYKSGHAFNEQKYNRMANLMGGCSVLREDEEATMCNDAHFCHGAAGLAQFYRTLYLTSQFPPYLNGYFKWIEKTVDFLKQDLALDAYNGKEGVLLSGLPGIALTLLSFVHDRELQWGKAFLLTCQR